jgi:dephospho-CoA kinase
MNWMISKTKMEQLGIHASETAWVGTKFDAVLDNNGTIDDLFAQVKDLVSNHLGANERPLDVAHAGSLHTLS